LVEEAGGDWFDIAFDCCWDKYVNQGLRGEEFVNALIDCAMEKKFPSDPRRGPILLGSVAGGLAFHHEGQQAVVMS
jgi:hypothetical protein